MSNVERSSAPHLPLPMQTLVQEAAGRQLMWLDGLLPLPLGSRIELDNIEGGPQVPLDPERFPTGQADAVVVGVRLSATQSAGRCLILEVDLRGGGPQDAAIEEAEAEEEVVEAAEMITERASVDPI